MKRIIKTITLSFLVASVTFSVVNGQAKSTEKRIKVVIAEGSGENTVIDTVFNDGLIRDSIILKDGKVIFIGKTGKNAEFISEDGDESIFVTVSSDGNDIKKEVKTVTIVSSDSAYRLTGENTGKIFVYSNDDSMDGHAGEKVVIMKDGKVIENDDGESYVYRYTTEVFDNDKSDYERTKYVITKDGMVISIEGSDYEKVKSLASDIEGKIDAGKDTEVKKAGKK